MDGRTVEAGRLSSAIDPTQVVAAASEICRKRRAQLTKGRVRILRLLVGSRRPMTAYELIACLEPEIGRRPKPPTVYRALEFLIQQGLIARIESRNAYFPTIHADGEHRDCIFLVCDLCSEATDLHNQALEALIAREAKAAGFRIDRRIVELQGLCAGCQQATVSPAGDSRPGTGARHHGH